MISLIIPVSLPCTVELIVPKNTPHCWFGYRKANIVQTFPMRRKETKGLEESQDQRSNPQRAEARAQVALHCIPLPSWCTLASHTVLTLTAVGVQIRIVCFAMQPLPIHLSICPGLRFCAIQWVYQPVIVAISTGSRTIWLFPQILPTVAQMDTTVQ